MTPSHDIRSSPKQPVIDRLLASRASLLAEAPPSLASARALADLADAAVTELAAGVELPGSWAVVALGGYGARRLLPASDLDLLIVSDAPPGRVKPLAEAVFYPLWDSGLPVGHQVRSRKEHLRACAADTATLTASLTGRIVAGDEALGSALLAEVARRACKNAARLLQQLAARPRPGSPYLLEPDLKEGAGGRRDLDEIAWTAAVLAGVPSADGAPLVPLGVLTAGELAALEEAAETLTAARWALHLAEGRHREVLPAELAEDLPLAPDTLAAALATVAHTLGRVRRRAARTPDPAPPATPDALLGALARGERALPPLEEAAWAGALEPLVPGLGALMDLRRPGLSHTLTVGAHCLASAAFVADAPARDSFAAEVLSGLADRRVLVAAALTHDFGKREPGPGHAQRGQDAARAVAVSLGLDRRAAEDVALLVREHLLLAETASRSDVGDEDAVLRAAARLGRRDLVGPLYVLTLADTLATRSDAWTLWRQTLTRELAARMEVALSPDVEGAGIAQTAEETRAAALALLGAADVRQRAFVELAPLRYLASTPPRLVAVHAELAAPLVGTRDISAAGVSVTPGPLPCTWRVTVATLDRHGLFATLAGVFALSGLSILDADAMAGPGDTAIDVFTVESATLAAVDTSTWAGFERELHAALGGHLELEVRLAERRRHYPPRKTRMRTRVNADASGYATSFRVETADRVGLLHDLARALADARLDITSATVLTHDGVASDTFRVVDASGDAPSDPAVLAGISRRLQLAAGGVG
ncbi:MAG TPA: ACT domain-containing protein [Coriobacteriia bacterium]